MTAVDAGSPFPFPDVTLGLDPRVHDELATQEMGMFPKLLNTACVEMRN